MLDVKNMTFSDLKAAADFASDQSSYFNQRVRMESIKDRTDEESMRGAEQWGKVYTNLRQEMINRFDANTPPSV
jgi:hypothetical protein